MADLENYYVDVMSLKFNMEVKFEDLIDRWFYICLKMPDISATGIVKIQAQLGKLSMFLLAPAILNHCTEKLGIFAGPVPFIESFEKIKKHGPSIEDFENIFQPKLFKYKNYWVEMAKLIETFAQNTVLCNPALIFMGIHVPGLEHLSKWMRNLEEAYSFIKIPRYEIQFKLSTTAFFTEITAHGYPQTLLSGVGLFPTPQADILTKSYYQCLPCTINHRLKFNLAKRDITRRQYIM